jgi:hypothetical protein
MDGHQKGNMSLVGSPKLGGYVQIWNLCPYLQPRISDSFSC